MISAPRTLGGWSAGTRRPTALVLLGVVLTVGACTGPTLPSESGQNGTEPGTAAEETSPATPEGASTPDGNTVAEGPEEEPELPGETDPTSVAASVQTALDALAARERAVTSEQVRAAIEQGFTEAGSTPESLEVSVDRTPTGLDVDAIQGAGLLDGNCVFGEVRAGDVSVAVLPALSSGFCFVGDQR